MAFLVRYIKAHNKFKKISCMFDKEKKNWVKKIVVHILILKML
jgi:hypothetical protein